jgi:hemerythrin-like metal-binding protein
MKLAWTPEIATGIAVIDDDHRRMIAAYNELVEAMKDGSDTESLISILDYLLAVMQEDFLREEKLMHRTKFPDVARHEAEHDALVVEFANARHRLLSGVTRVVDREALRQFQRWVLVHIVEMDVACIAHFRSLQDGERPAETHHSRRRVEPVAPE